MSKRRALGFAVVAIISCLLPLAGVRAGDDMTGLFPDMDGLKKDGDPGTYLPESLFEYIDGAADVYLSYEFEELATLTYDGGENQSLSIDVYRHSDLRSAFGIYSQEKPQQGRFVRIGTQGYYEKGVLNFFHGRYYVKLVGFYLGEDDEKTLTEAAAAIAERLGGEPAFPKALGCFPSEGKVANSERFLAQDVLGHGFLHSAYAADYEVNGSSVRVFLIEGKDENDANEMLQKYLELAQAGGPVIVEKETCRFIDPRRGSAERFNLRKAGRYLWGLSASDASTADRFLGAVEDSLRSHGLIE